MPRPRDAGISDIAGTLLMVGAVVLAGGGLTALVTANLSAPALPLVSLALAPVAAGDSALSLVVKNGGDLALAELSLALRRDAGPSVDVPRSDWSTPNASYLRAGDRLTFTISPAAGGAERFDLAVYFTPQNAQLGVLAARTGSASLPLPDATLVGNLTPSSLVADGVSAARVTLRVSHPWGAGAIARVVADLANLSNASSTANATLDLSDTGRDGDEMGGDGNWSALLRAPALTTPGVYNITLRATDLAGRLAGSTVVRLNITGNVSFAVGGYGSGNGTGAGGGGTGGNVSGGNCYGCIVSGGVSSYEGTRLSAPTSENVTQFRLRNWTWDKLSPAKIRDDALVIRIVNGSAPWSAYFRFDYLSSTPCMTYARFWTSTNDTSYAPRNGTCLSLVDLDLNILDPVGSQQLVRTSGTGDPFSLYQHAGLTGRTTFILAYLRDEDPTGQDELSQQIGVFSMDVVMA